MAGNPYDQFDAVGAANPYDQFDAQPRRQLPVLPIPGESLNEKLFRAVGLTARHGIEGVGSTLDTLASPIRIGMNAVLPANRQITGNTGESVANALNLPKPENPKERVAGDVARTMAATGGMGFLAKILATAGPAVIKPVMDALSANQGTQAVSSAGAGAGEGLARESGGGWLAQILAELAGSVTAPAATSIASGIGSKAADIGATLASAFGNKRAINRLASEVASSAAKEAPQSIRAALNTATEYVSGVRPTVSDAIAEANMGRPSQMGGATIRLQKDLSGAKGIEDILPSAVRGQKVAQDAAVSAMEAKAGPMRDSALMMANQGGGGVSSAGIINAIDAKLTIPGLRGSDVVQKVMGDVKTKLAELRDKTTGLIDANDLYTVRKEIGNTVSRNAKETANWDKRLSAGLERTIQKQIDDAIESAGGLGWKDYLRTYADTMRGVAMQKARADEAKRIAASVKSNPPGEKVAGVPNFPHLLSWPIVATNFGLKLIAHSATTPIARELATRMQDPKEYAKLLSRPQGDPIRKIAEDILQKATVAGSVASQQTSSQ